MCVYVRERMCVPMSVSVYVCEGECVFVSGFANVCVYVLMTSNVELHLIKF